MTDPTAKIHVSADEFAVVSTSLSTLVGAGILSGDDGYRLLVGSGVIDDVRGGPEERDAIDWSHVSPRRWLFGSATVGVGAALAMFHAAVLFSTEARVAILGKPSTVADALGLTDKLFGAKYVRRGDGAMDAPNGVRVGVFRPDEIESIRGREFSFLLVLDWPVVEHDWWMIETAVRRGRATIVAAKLPPIDYVQSIVAKPDTYMAVES